jgi:Mn-dependent DtxR family transcriptional regulator
MKLSVDAAVAAEDACKLEHAISDESLQAIKAFIQK